MFFKSSLWITDIKSTTAAKKVTSVLSNSLKYHAIFSGNSITHTCYVWLNFHLQTRNIYYVSPFEILNFLLILEASCHVRLVWKIPHFFSLNIFLLENLCTFKGISLGASSFSQVIKMHNWGNLFCLIYRIQKYLYCMKMILYIVFPDYL